MGDEIDVIVPLSEKQMQDTIDARLNKRGTHRHEAIKSFEEKVREFQKQGKPWCFRCAKKDFEKAQAEEFIKPGGKLKYKFERNVPIKLNLTPYGDPKRFQKLEEREVVETRRFNGEKARYVTTYSCYACKMRGCRISVETNERKDTKKEVTKE